MGNHNTIPMTNQLTLPQEMINRLEKRKRECWQNQSPYIDSKSEYIELVIKIKELTKLKK